MFKESKEELVNLLKKMLQIRYFEEKVWELLAKNIIKGASHVYVGEEAVAVGAISCLRDDDYITSTHRGHGHCLAKGGEIKYMLAELCGKVTGYCRGRGGSMHIADVTKGNLGATGIVGSNIPVATGAGLSIKLRGTDQVCLCFFGDGATNNGVFHESLNIASLWKLPVIYIIENNLYGMSTSVEKASAVKDLYKKACAYNMPGEPVDGMDVLAVKEAVSRAVARARKGEGPTLLECKTYRYYGHSRSDSKVYRDKREEEEWKKRDPILTFSNKLLNAGIITPEELKKLKEEIEKEIAEAEEFALSSPYPPLEELEKDVYVEGD
ncbi:MAG TPA: pyruvate dehydrogenase (acetyl-transferring) E1 component subunit alpha [bacterium]|nr:pyruvate dehydrogenase (acetyl-transferring) E1 component subunit alpha [bacterium]HEX67674.1 pyruvate dehydrogenase (acetyl-transferring) E1 component subunit alpha [bacterium]